MGNNSSQPFANKTLHIDGAKPYRRAFVQDCNGSRLMTSESDLRAGRALNPMREGSTSPIPRESFDIMWGRLHHDTEYGFAVRLGDDDYAAVENFYITHPTAPFVTVRGFAVSLLYPWTENLKRSLNRLLSAGAITFHEYVTEIKNMKDLIAAADRPELYIVFSDETYSRWGLLIQRAETLDASYDDVGVVEYIRAKLQTLFYNGVLYLFAYQSELGELQRQVDETAHETRTTLVFSNEAYDHWEPLMTQAEQLEAMVAAQAVQVSSYASRSGYVLGTSPY